METTPASTSRTKPSTASEFITGARLLGRGLRIVSSTPRLMVLGMLPGLIASFIVVVLFAVMLYFIADLASLATWFADDWTGWLRTSVRILAGAAIVWLSLTVAAMTFAALTLTIGDPFYEAISAQVDARFGGIPGHVEQPWHRTFWPNLADSSRLLAVTFVIGIGLFIAGLVPIAGQSVVPVIDVLIAGWILALEVSGVAFNRRGLRLAQRRRILREHWACALGFGIPIVLIFLIPLAAIVMMPAAVAGATLLTRRALGEPYT